MQQYVEEGTARLRKLEQIAVDKCGKANCEKEETNGTKTFIHFKTIVATNKNGTVRMTKHEATNPKAEKIVLVNNLNHERFFCQQRIPPNDVLMINGTQLEACKEPTHVFLHNPALTDTSQMPATAIQEIPSGACSPFQDCDIPCSTCGFRSGGINHIYTIKDTDWKFQYSMECK